MEIERPTRRSTTDATALAAQYDAAGRHDDAVNELARAAQRGDTRALTELGKRLIVGDRAPLLPQDGARLLDDALRRGGSEAALRLANLAALGAYVPPNWHGALRLLAFAAQWGNACARAQLTVLAGRTLADGARAEDWQRLAERVDLGAWLSARPGTTLHEQPLVRCFPDLISDQACEWLIRRARGRLERALVYDPASGRDIADHIRTNSAAGFNLMDADLVQIAVQYRMAAVVGLPVAHMEGPTVLHYGVGQQIRSHFDFVDPRVPDYEEQIRTRGERIITFLIYLNDDYGGGETDFECLGVRHKGRRREGLFFVNALPDGRPDTRMAHAGLPPTSGEKWIAAQFIRNRPVLPAPGPSGESTSLPALSPSR